MKCELRNDYEKLELPRVEKIELKSNEFGVKYRILREAPEQKFLLYREGPPPTDLEQIEGANRRGQQIEGISKAPNAKYKDPIDHHREP